MATVAVTVAGRTYRMACSEGEEAHLHRLARHVDRTLASLRKGFGEIGDARLFVMTAITVTDELFETRRRLQELDMELAQLKAVRTDGEALRDALAVEVSASLDEVSDHLERLAHDLDRAAQS